MNLLTDHEKDAAVAAQGPGTGFSIALAEAHAYYDQHGRGRPSFGHQTLSIKIDGDTPAERYKNFAEAAAWLGVTPSFRNGVWFAQRRWEVTPGESVTIDAHYTPDHDAAYAQQTARGAA